MRTKNLLNGKPESGFRGLSAVLPAFGLAFAVFAATGMLAAGCDSLAGSGPGDETVFTEVFGSAPDGGSSVVLKKIQVKFVVCNGGWGLVKTEGIVSTADDSQLVYDSGSWSESFDISILADEADDYVNIRWVGTDAMFRKFWVKGKMPVKAAGRYAVVLDFNEEKTTDGWDVDTQNLEEVYEYGPGGKHEWLPADWDEAKSRSVADVDDTFILTDEEAAASEGVFGLAASAAGYAQKTVKVKFDVKNGGWGLVKSQGIISTQDDSYGASDYALFANDFTITIIVPAWERYLNIRWKATDGRQKNTYLKSGLQLSEDGNGGIYNYNIVLDYNGRGKVATKNLSDVTVNTEDVNNDFSSALKRAAGIKVKFEVKNGGNGLTNSYGIVSTVSKDKSLSLWNDADFANSVWDVSLYATDFSITIGGVPPDAKWLTIIWAGSELVRAGSPDPHTCIIGSLELNGSSEYTVTVDYNGRDKVETKNLQSVEFVNSWIWNKVYEKLWF